MAAAKKAAEKAGTARAAAATGGGFTEGPQTFASVHVVRRFLDAAWKSVALSRETHVITLVLSPCHASAIRVNTAPPPTRPSLHSHEPRAHTTVWFWSQAVRWRRAGGPSAGACAAMQASS
eukprot:2157450-Prymnesium_polylepis.1